ncbi:hypothetical protein ACFL47_09970 [Candidatus Latescibacterota bacterium]
MSLFSRKPSVVETSLGPFRYTGSEWEGFKDYDGDELQVLLSGSKDGPDEDAVRLITASWNNLGSLIQVAKEQVQSFPGTYMMTGILTDEKRRVTLQFNDENDSMGTLFVDFDGENIVRHEFVH